MYTETDSRFDAMNYSRVLIVSHNHFYWTLTLSTCIVEKTKLFHSIGWHVSGCSTALGSTAS